MYDQKTESPRQTCHSIHRTTGAEPRKSPDYYKPLFFFGINMQRLGQALGTNSTTRDASVRKACPPCLRTITAWDKVVRTSLDLVLEPPSSLREPYVAQSLLWLGKAEKVLFLLVSELLMVSGSSYHHWATLVPIPFFFFFSHTARLLGS